MDDDADYISEYEELLKIKEFSQDSRMRMPYYCTYELIAKALKDEYAENTGDRIERWANVTHVPYFENVKPVTYYFQAKMLYRDGFYEASIVLARSVCEMICYDLLSRTAHPFGDIESIEVPVFRVFVNFLAIPKTIERSAFEEQIIARINDLDDANFAKSSYKFDKSANAYSFKIENGRKKDNLARFLKIFGEVGFNNTDSFRSDTHQYLHRVYDIGNLYVHAKENLDPFRDATECLDMLAYILSDIYGVPALSAGKTIKSGYTDFPDVCKGMNFATEVAPTPEDAQRIYLNLPSQDQIDSVMQVIGVWNGEWRNERGESQTGVLTFFSNRADHLDANLRYTGVEGRERTESMEIRLFGSYFHLIGFDENDMKHRRNEHVFFELELLNNRLLVGQNIEHQGKAVFQRSE